jgi:hypothetical protein
MPIKIFWVFLFCFLKKMNLCNIKTRGTKGPWLTPVILATQEAENRRITVQSQPQAHSS